jgi:signal transduction histidine kinase
MRARALGLLMRPTSPPPLLGIAAAAALIAAETLVVYPLRQVAPEISLGVVYLLGVLLVASVWGLGLGVVTAVFSTAAFDFFHVPPIDSIVFDGSQGQAALVILLAIALLLGFIAALARSRAIEADERRREADERRGEADLAAEMARLLLRTDGLRSALPEAGSRLAQALELPAATIELDAAVGGEGRFAFPLRDGDAVLGTLLVPAELPPRTEARLRERVVPSVEALLRAAREREAMTSALKASRDERSVLADEQAALRRVATLVARGVPPAEVLAAVSEEVGGLLPVDFADIGRYEPDGTVTVLAPWGKAVEHFPVGSRWPLGGRNLSTIVFETGHPARMDNYADASGPIGVASGETGVRSAVATPIVVEGRLWGVMTADSTLEQPLPVDSEARLASFTELVATAIANAESRAGLARLAEQQAALRRVATLVARGVPPEEVFEAVTEEVVGLLGLDSAAMSRYESDGTMSAVTISGRLKDVFPVGRRWSLKGKNVSTIVFETGSPARIESYADPTDDLSAALREQGLRSAVGTPIVVEGRLWGVMSASSEDPEPLPADTEQRLISFTELVATAIANAENRAAVAASRARIVAAADDTRRRIERDLHDGAQQRLVHAVIVLKLALGALRKGDAKADELVAEALRHAEQANAELRELAHGILPAALTRGGLRAGVEGLVSRVSVPVSVGMSAGRLPADVEATAYFVISEGLTNVVKHASADHATVTVQAEPGAVRVEIRDDGIGGADPARGSGLVGISDRVEALGGTLEVNTPPGSGTTLLIEIPLAAQTRTDSLEP